MDALCLPLHAYTRQDVVTLQVLPWVANLGCAIPSLQ